MNFLCYRNDIPLKSETKKRSRQVSSSTTRTKVSRHSNKSTNDETNESTKSLKKTHSTMNSNQFLPPPPLPPTTTIPHQAQQQQQQMFQNLFHSFQNQANYWPMSPWPVPPSIALMGDPRNYYTQPWSHPTSHPHPHPPPPPPHPSHHQSPVIHGPRDLSSASLHDFIGESSNPVFPIPPSSALLNSASNFARTPSTNSLHLSNRHRPTTLNGTLS